MEQTGRAVPISKALFAVVVWGASFIATKIALAEVQPMTVVWLRFAMGVGVMGAVVALRRQLALPSAADLAYFAGLGFLGIAFHQWLQSNGLVTAQAGTTAWIAACGTSRGDGILTARTKPTSPTSRTCSASRAARSTPRPTATSKACSRKQRGSGS